MKKALVASICVALTVVAARAQVRIEAGRAGELKDVRKIFIRAETPDKQSIAAEIAKRLPQVKIVDDSERADALLIFTVSQASSFANWSNAFFGMGEKTPSTALEYEISVAANVVKPTSSRRLRTLIRFADSRRAGFRNDMATRFAKIFVDAYISANP
jgi:hypothetical protein